MKTLFTTIALVAGLTACTETAKDTGTKEAPPPPPPPASTLPATPQVLPTAPPPAAANMQVGSPMSPEAAKASVTAANADQVAAELEGEIMAELNAPE